VSRYAPPINFFKRKKEKKESRHLKWKVSKKQVFRIKYYLIRWRFYPKPVGLELAFLNTWNLSLLPFFFIFFEFPINPCFEIGYYSGIVLSNVIVI
jgi:hypothetical protein